EERAGDPRLLEPCLIMVAIANCKETPCKHRNLHLFFPENRPFYRSNYQLIQPASIGMIAAGKVAVIKPILTKE
ncbi:MAG TPA: hypothetical protein VMR33_18980, partial [Candidatus Baltobacteraceae bacterium]|nr:hypothetical protein [Candidatus Baltobacteraceae bacterium]